jgi:CubicO group peptidase (beta-lactamase class C family)
MPSASRVLRHPLSEAMQPIRHTALLLFLALLPLASAAAAPDCGEPQARADGWSLATPGSVGLDTKPLCAIVPHFTRWLLGANIHAVLVARHGRLVYEHYFKGDDEDGGHHIPAADHGPDTLHDLRSVGKSVTSLVLGIGIDRGWVPDVNTPVLNLLPQYADLRTPEKDRITLRHLLTMSQGLQWYETGVSYDNPTNSETQMNRAAEPYRYVLSQPARFAPGTVWNYSSGSASLISAVVQQATGKRLDVLAQEVLFGPLGITNVSWHHFRNGDPDPAGGLRMAPRDLLKLGQLVLNRGTWNGRQVVSGTWIDASTTPYMPTTRPGYSYGYQWWIGHSLVDGQAVDWSAGQGLGGQRLYVIPRLDMVVLVMAGLYDSPTQLSVPVEVLDNYVLAGVR